MQYSETWFCVGGMPLKYWSFTIVKLKWHSLAADTDFIFTVQFYREKFQLTLWITCWYIFLLNKKDRAKQEQSKSIYYFKCSIYFIHDYFIIILNPVTNGQMFVTKVVIFWVEDQEILVFHNMSMRQEARNRRSESWLEVPYFDYYTALPSSCKSETIPSKLASLSVVLA